jgi:hypothetical protein
MTATQGEVYTRPRPGRPPRRVYQPPPPAPEPTDDQIHAEHIDEVEIEYEWAD